MIPDVKAIIYLDLDTLIMTNLEKTWKKFDEFKDNEIMGASNDCPFSGQE